MKINNRKNAFGYYVKTLLIDLGLEEDDEKESGFAIMMFILQEMIRDLSEFLGDLEDEVEKEAKND